MATQFCQKCKQAHPGRACDYDEKAECAESVDPDDNPEAFNEKAGEKKPPKMK